VRDFGYSRGHFMIASSPWAGALEGIRTPNLLIRSKIRFVQIWPPLSIRAAGTLCGDLAVPALSLLVQIRC
jgi:hypothetical protein